MRGPGEGSVREKRRADGSVFYEARASIHGQQRSFCADTKSGAMAKARAARADAERGHTRPNAARTLAEHLRDWLEHQVKPSVRLRTYVSYHGHAENHIIPELGHLRLDEVTPGQVTRMLSGVIAKGVSDTTAQRVRATLSAAYKAAMLDYGVLRNPAALAKAPRSDRPQFQREVVKPEDAREILAAFDGSRLWPLVAFSLATGVRQGELLALRWQDIDGTAAHIRHAVDFRDGHRILARPKSDKAHRTVPLSSLALSAIEARRGEIETERMLAGDAYTDRQLVFAGPSGDFRDGAAVTRNFRARLVHRGLPSIRWHALRRIYAATLQAAGVPLHVIRDLMGHSELGVTEKYAYTMPGSDADVLAALNAAFGAGPARDNPSGDPATEARFTQLTL